MSRAISLSLVIVLFAACCLGVSLALLWHLHTLTDDARRAREGWRVAQDGWRDALYLIAEVESLTPDERARLITDVREWLAQYGQERVR